MLSLHYGRNKMRLWISNPRIKLEYYKFDASQLVWGKVHMRLGINIFFCDIYELVSYRHAWRSAPCWGVRIQSIETSCPITYQYLLTEGEMVKCSTNRDCFEPCIICLRRHTTKLHCSWSWEPSRMAFSKVFALILIPTSTLHTTNSTLERDCKTVGGGNQ